MYLTERQVPNLWQAEQSTRARFAEPSSRHFTRSEFASLAFQRLAKPLRDDCRLAGPQRFRKDNDLSRIGALFENTDRPVAGLQFIDGIRWRRFRRPTRRWSHSHSALRGRSATGRRRATKRLEIPRTPDQVPAAANDSRRLWSLAGVAAAVSKRSQCAL